MRSQKLTSEPASVQRIHGSHGDINGWTLNIHVALGRGFVYEYVYTTSMSVALFNYVVSDFYFPIGS